MYLFFVKGSLNMKSFDYVIKDSEGIHARPAGALVNLAKAFDDEITISKEGKQADAKRLLSVMGLCIKYDDKITVTVQGETEEKASEKLKEFFNNNL